MYAGVDEVGYGAWAGPFVAGAVIIPPRVVLFPHTIQDSKALSPKKRSQWALHIKQTTHWALGWAQVTEFSTTCTWLDLNFLAMYRALLHLPQTFSVVHVDGIHAPKQWPWPTQMHPKGDCNDPAIAAASIIAKDFRDRWMHYLHTLHPPYAWHTNKGYGTRLHRHALETWGQTAYHRPLKHHTYKDA